MRFSLDALLHVVLVAVAALLFSATPTDTIRVHADSDSVHTRAEMAPIQVRPVIPLGDLYSGTLGIGLGAGIGVENVGWPGSDVTATAFVAQHGYGADLTLTSSDPYTTPLYGVLHGELTRATRRRFFGTGPFTAEADLLELRHTQATVEARLGAYPLGTTALLVQPSARLLIDHVDALDLDTEAALRQLDASSQASARTVVGDTRMGVSFGLELASDRLDQPDYPSSGTYASVEARRFVALDGSDLRFTRFASSISGYIPVRGRTVLMAHATGIVTRQDADAILPFTVLPTLDNTVMLAYPQDRFRGRDALALSLGIRIPVASLYGLYGIDAELAGTAGNTYTNLFDQFAPSVSFASALPEDTTAPLRPAASLGVSLVNLSSQSRVVGGRIGVSPEGLWVGLVSRFSDLRDVVPLFR
ncbi:MAG: BamA/TamA family outer membrane protein [Rubricoccaceae bacterium]